MSRWDPDEHAAVIAMEMRERQRVDAVDCNAKLKQPHGCPAIGIDQEMGLSRGVFCNRRYRSGKRVTVQIPRKQQHHWALARRENQ